MLRPPRLPAVLVVLVVSFCLGAAHGQEVDVRAALDEIANAAESVERLDARYGVYRGDEAIGWIRVRYRRSYSIRVDAEVDGKTLSYAIDGETIAVRIDGRFAALRASDIVEGLRKGVPAMHALSEALGLREIETA